MYPRHFGQSQATYQIPIKSSCSEDNQYQGQRDLMLNLGKQVVEVQEERGTLIGHRKDKTVDEERPTKKRHMLYTCFPHRELIRQADW